MKILLFTLSFILMANSASATIKNDITDPRIVASYEQLKLSNDIVNLFWHSYNHHSNPITQPQAMQRIIDAALLAKRARETLEPDVLNRSIKVSFDNDVMLQDRATSLLRKGYEKAIITNIKSLPGGNLDSIIQFDDALTKNKLLDMMALKAAIMIRATKTQEAQAKTTIIAKLTIDKQVSEITLWDIYRRQNVQGKLSIHQGDLDFLKTQTAQRAGSLFILNWAKKNIPAEDFYAINQILLNEQHKTRLRESFGLHQDVHHDNPVQRARAKLISEEKIKAYYEENKEEFRIVERVKARHIRISDQNLSDSIITEIRNGLDFGEAIKKYSEADDKNDKIPGSLGWLNRADKNRSFLHSVAFAQHPGEVSSSFRTPQPDGSIAYEILWADERIEGYLPYTDPTIQYEASHDIAAKELRDEFLLLQKNLRADADIRLNPRAIRALK